MAISTRNELKTAIPNWLIRPASTTVTGFVDDWIALAETRFNREQLVQAMETVVTFNIPSGGTTPGRVALPSDFNGCINIRLTDQLVSMEQIDRDVFRRHMADDSSTGQPQFFAVIGNEFNFWKKPDTDYSAELCYWAKVPALSDSQTTNWLLTNAPDVYLFGSLVAACAHLEDLEQEKKWELRYQLAISTLVKWDSRVSKPVSSDAVKIPPRGLYGGGEYGAPPSAKKPPAPQPAPPPPVV